jgi:hypothetical protein
MKMAQTPPVDRHPCHQILQSIRMLDDWQRGLVDGRKTGPGNFPMNGSIPGIEAVGHHGGDERGRVGRWRTAWHPSLAGKKLA